MRHVYQQRRKLLFEALRADFSRWLVPIPSTYGMHIGARARAAVDLERALEELSRRQVKVHSFGRYYLGPQTQSGLIFGYGTAGVPELKYGLACLREALSKSV
jgi:GntR family transcriptional regulator/MocR family aminotransferase